MISSSCLLDNTVQILIRGGKRSEERGYETFELLVYVTRGISFLRSCKHRSTVRTAL